MSNFLFYYYFAFWPKDTFLVDFFTRIAKEAGLNPSQLPQGVRLRRRGDLNFAFNFSAQDVEIPVSTKAHFLVGSKEVQPGEVAIWRE
jgi:beta-galactosidase